MMSETSASPDVELLELVEAMPQAKVKSVPKPPRAVKRVSAIEKKIAFGLQLLDLQLKASGNNIEFARLRRKFDGRSLTFQIRPLRKSN
jgi:hypothetical protein